jgi:hypothetical protein
VSTGTKKTGKFPMDDNHTSPRYVCSTWNEISLGWRGEFSRWGAMAESNDPGLAKNRIFDGYARIGVTPKFTFDTGTPVYTIGSCFARNIEAALTKVGVPIADKYRSEKKYVTADRASDAGLFNRFNVPTIYYDAKAAAEPDWLGERLMFDIGDDKAFDAFFSPAQGPGSRDEKLSIRKEILEYQHSFLKSAGAVFITLGLSEALVDRDSGLYLNGSPPPRWAARNANRFSSEVISVTDTIEYLLKTRESLRSVAGDGLKIIVTVSPVPLANTFTGGDVVVANASSKARLRIAAEEFASFFSDVDYFPSYEIVTHSEQSLAFAVDKRHVRSQMVTHIMNTFMHHYFGKS